MHAASVAETNRLSKSPTEIGRNELHINRYRNPVSRSERRRTGAVNLLRSVRDIRQGNREIIANEACPASMEESDIRGRKRRHAPVDEHRPGRSVEERVCLHRCVIDRRGVRRSLSAAVALFPRCAACVALCVPGHVLRLTHMSVTMTRERKRSSQSIEPR